MALLFLDHGTRRAEGSASALTALYPGKDPVPNAQEAGWASGPVWMGAENLATTGIRSPDHPARSQSLHRLSYPARKPTCTEFNFLDKFLRQQHPKLWQNFSILINSESKTEFTISKNISLKQMSIENKFLSHLPHTNNAYQTG